MLQIIKTFLWESLKETSYIHVFKHFQIFIVDLLMIYFYGKRFHHKIKFRHPTIKFDFKYSKSSIECLEKQRQKQRQE